MSKRILVLIIALILVAAVSFGAAKTYQVTGPVLEVTPTMIAVQKGADRWEIARDAGTKVTGDLKVGSKVTIEYRMTATAVTVKDAAAKPAKKK
ncbi:MAG TPA: hypothetical protein VF505_04980 [Thermoanaerobaculia bacterium]|jgi:hypothetical protein